MPIKNAGKSRAETEGTSPRRHRDAHSRLFHLADGAAVFDWHDLYKLRPELRPVLDDVPRAAGAGVVQVVLDQR